MAQRIIHAALTVPPGTAFDLPYEQPLDFLPGDVTQIRVHVRRGHSALTGLMIYYGAQQVVPSTESTEYLIGDNRTYEYDVDLFLTGEGWLAIMANTDVYEHTFDVDFLLDELTASSEDELPLVFVPLAFESQGVSVAG